MDLEEFMQALHQKYPQMELTPVMNSADPYLLDFKVKGLNGNWFCGMLSKDRQGITLRAGLEESAEFAVWLQTLYSDLKNLIFLDEQASFLIDLFGRKLSEVMELAYQDFYFLQAGENPKEHNNASLQVN